MAKNDAPARPKWYQAIGQAFTFIRKNDKVFLPVFIVMEVLIIGGFTTAAIMAGGIAAPIYLGFAALITATLAAVILLSLRIDPAIFNQIEGVFGGSLRALQLIRRGWKFFDDPAEIDPRGKAVTFLGVGKGGIVLASEGGAAGRKTSATARRRISRLAPGVPIHEFFVGSGADEINIRRLPKAVKRLKKVLSRRERPAITARIAAIGGSRLPVPKGMDPMRVRPDRKALRGR